MTDSLPAGLPRESLSDADRRAIREARADLVAEPLAAGTGQMGCLAAIVGAVALLVAPRVVPLIPGGAFLAPFVTLAAVLAILGGVVWSMFGGNSGRAAARAAVESALRHIEDVDSDRDVLLRACTVLVSRAHIVQGPTTIAVIDSAHALPRLGERLPLVVAVELYLIEEFGEYEFLTFMDEPA
jgi:hypothetical protein